MQIAIAFPQKSRLNADEHAQSDGHFVYLRKKKCFVSKSALNILCHIPRSVR